MAFKLDSKIPAGELAQKWSNHKAAIKVVSPANKRKLDIIIVGTGLGGASAAASLGELGYNVKVFCIQDSPRRAHSIAAQGGPHALAKVMSSLISTSESWPSLRRSIMVRMCSSPCVRTA